MKGSVKNADPFFVFCRSFSTFSLKNFYARACYSLGMEIIVEAVLIDNFCLDLFLSYAATLAVRRKTEVRRFLLAATIGSGLALLSPLVLRFALLYKIATLFLLTAILFGKWSLREYLIFTFVYAFINFTFAGVLSFFLGGTLKLSFIGLDRGLIVAAVAASCFVFLYSFRQITGLLRERRYVSKLARVEFVCGEKRFELSALFDTGNLLTDEDGNDVILIDEKSIDAANLPTMGSIPIQTASGSKVLPLVKIPEIKIYSEDGENKLTNVTAALSDLPKEYSVILPYK